MRAGAREFFALPLAATEVADALARFSVNVPGERPVKKRAGRLAVVSRHQGRMWRYHPRLAVWCMRLARESGKKVLLIDMGLPLGDAALNLGIIAEYSTDNAFRKHTRLDGNFLHLPACIPQLRLVGSCSPQRISQTMPLD